MRKMKNRGIAWVEECPEHWEQHPVYYYFSERKAPNVLLSETNLLSLSYGKIKRKDINTNGGLLPASFNTYNIIEEGDIIIRPTDLQNDKRSLRTALSTEHGIITSAYIALRPKQKVNSAYFHYLLHAYDVQKVFYNMGNGVRQGLNYSEFSKLKLLAPPIDEQKSIVSFLDSKCSDIDALVNDIQAEISTLEEYKKSVITEAVTKGLNPDAKMKDSGVAWVGECPEHWKILKIRDSINKIESGVSVNAASYPAGDNEIGVLKTSCVSKYIFDARENKAVNKNEESRVSCPVRKGCIIVSRMNTPDLVGACGYVAEEVNGIYLPDRLWQVHVKTTYSAQYVTYYLMSHIARSYYASIAVGTSTTMQNISQIEFGCMFFCVPEIEEQQAIADYLDAKCDEIAATIAEKQKQLTTLEEYKKSLIYEYVTGKKEVPAL